MKNFLFIFLAGCIPAMVFTNSAIAQSSISIAKLDQPKQVIMTGSTIIPPKENTVDLKDISTKAIKNFRKSFKMINGETWLICVDGFAAKFTLNGISNTIYYTKRGQWFGSLKGYTEDKLTGNIRGIVKSKYYDYKIIYVQEIETTQSEGIPTFIVHIEDDITLKLIRIKDGEMDLYKAFTK